MTPRFENVFVLCTGRCGSTTFYKACSHIKNYTSGHESKISDPTMERFKFPKHHIEIDNRLSWFLPLLDVFNNENRTFYVHLVRNFELTVNSFMKRKGPKSHLDNFIRGFCNQNDVNENRYQLAKRMVATIDMTINNYVHNKPHVRDFFIEAAKEQFPYFCEQINADVNIEKAIKEFDIKYNKG